MEEELTGPAVTNLCARAKAGDLPDGSVAISMHWMHATDEESLRDCAESLLALTDVVVNSKL